MPDQDVAQGSYIALPLTLLLLLAAYNHEKVRYKPHIHIFIPGNGFNTFDSLIQTACEKYLLLTLSQVIPLLLLLVNRIQGVRSMAQASSDSAALDEAKRQAKRQKARRT